MLQKFQVAGGDLKRAKDFYNAIHAPHFNIPIEQVKMIINLKVFLGIDAYHSLHALLPLILVVLFNLRRFSCIPGLHISLDLFLKFYVLFENAWSEMDERIIAKLAESEAVSNDLNIDKHLESLRQAHKHEIQSKQCLEQATLSEEYMMYLIAASGMEMDDAQAHPTIVQLMETVKLL